MSSDPFIPSAPGAVGPSRTGVWPNIKVMWRVIFALMIRDSRTRYGGSDLGYLWAVINPLAQLVVLIIVFTLLGRRVPIPTSLPVFFTVGLLPYQFWHSCVSRGATAATSNIPLLTYPQVKVIDVLISRVLLDAVTLVVTFLIFIFALHYVTGEPFGSWFGDPLQIVFAFSALFYFSLAFAIFSSSLARIFPLWREIFAYMSRPLWFTSGIFFTLQQLPKGFQGVAIFNPIAHVLEWIKSAMIPGFHSYVYSPLYVLGLGTVVLLIGLVIDWFLRLIGHADESE